MKELLTTPIFKVIEQNEVEAGFKPVAVVAPDWISTIVEKDGKFLVVKQLRFGTMAETVEFPAGTVETGESVQHAAARELFEETGIIVDSDNLKQINECSPNPAFMTNTKYVFYVNLNEINYSKVNQRLDEHEHITYEWVDKFELTKSFNKNSYGQPAMFAASLLAYWNYKGLFDYIEKIKNILLI